MFVKGDRLIAIKSMGFMGKGDIIEIIDVNKDIDAISFMFDGLSGVMSFEKCEEYFTKIPETTDKLHPSITHEHIEKIMANSNFTVHTSFDKCTIVSCKLPNGYVIVESSACVSPENYNEEMGVSICLDKIADKIRELEGYRLQEDLYRENGCPYGCNDCDECDCPYSDYDEFDEEFDECLNTDLDCDDCKNFYCPYNTNNNKI